MSGERNGNSLKYSNLESSIDREAWWAIAHEGCKGPDTTGNYTLRG